MHAGSDLLGGFHRRRGHDVEVAGIGRQVVSRAFDLKEHRDLEPGVFAVHLRDLQRAVGADVLELHRLLEPVARDIALHFCTHSTEERRVGHEGVWPWRYGWWP